MRLFESGSIGIGIGIGAKSQCLDRTQFVLRVYWEWVQRVRASEGDPDGDTMDIAHWIDGGGISPQYTMTDILCDFQYLVQNEAILGYHDAAKQDDDDDDDSVCDGASCFIMERQQRPRNGQKEQELFFAANLKQSGDDEEQSMTRSLAVQQCLDSVHCFVHHELRLNVQQIAERIAKQKAVDNDHDDDHDDGDQKDVDFAALCHDELAAEIGRITKETRSRSSRFRERAEDQKYNKFTTTKTYTATTATVQQLEQEEDDCIEQEAERKEAPKCFMEIVGDDLAAFGVQQEVVEKLKKLVDAERFDTDSFIEDMDGAEGADSAFGAILDGVSKDGVMAVVSDRIFVYKSQNEQYSSGVRFFYWPYYEKNDAESNLVHRYKGCAVIEENPGYRLCDWYIAPKYTNFKEEILMNPLSALNLRQWKETLQKAYVKLAAYNKNTERRRMICGANRRRKDGAGNKWQPLYGIKEDDEVTISHIMALLFYTNYSKASYEFSASFRRIFWNETDESLKGRHSAFCHQARLLRELVEAFGGTMGHCPSSVFYHGVSTDLVFEGTLFKLHGPLSTTSGMFLFLGFLCVLCICVNLMYFAAFDVAHGTFSKKSGIVVDIRNVKGSPIERLFEALL